MAKRFTPSHVQASPTVRKLNKAAAAMLKRCAERIATGELTLHEGALAAAEWHLHAAKRFGIQLAHGRAQQFYERARHDLSSLVAAIQHGYNPMVTLKVPTAPGQEHTMAPSPFPLKTCWRCQEPSTLTATVTDKQGRKHAYALCETCAHDIETGRLIVEDLEHRSRKAP